MIRIWLLLALLFVIAIVVVHSLHDHPPPRVLSMADCDIEVEIGSYYQCLHEVQRSRIRVIDTTPKK